MLSLLKRPSWSPLVRALLLGLFLFGCLGQARADNCTASMTAVSFGPVDSTAGTDYYANGTLSVTCTVLLGSLGTAVVPSVAICLNLEGGAGGTIAARNMLNGGSTLPFNLYRDSTYAAASVWGSTSGGTAQPVTSSMTGVLGLGTATQTFTIYGKIPAASLAGARLQNSTDTPFTADFSGAGSLQYAFYGLLAPATGCKAGTTVPFGFKATATLTNNCFISTSTRLSPATTACWRQPCAPAARWACAAPPAVPTRSRSTAAAWPATPLHGGWPAPPPPTGSATTSRTRSTARSGATAATAPGWSAAPAAAPSRR
jgi:spore coat protein U-like protein